MFFTLKVNQKVFGTNESFLFIFVFSASKLLMTFLQNFLLAEQT